MARIYFANTRRIVNACEVYVASVNDSRNYLPFWGFVKGAFPLVLECPLDTNSIFRFLSACGYQKNLDFPELSISLHQKSISIKLWHVTFTNQQEITTSVSNGCLHLLTSTMFIFGLRLKPIAELIGLLGWLRSRLWNISVMAVFYMAMPIAFELSNELDYTIRYVHNTYTNTE